MSVHVDCKDYVCDIEIVTAEDLSRQSLLFFPREQVRLPDTGVAVAAGNGIWF